MDQPITHGRVLRIAAPIILSNMTIPLIGVFDTAIIGQLGQASLIGAVGLGATIITLFYWGFGFLRMATTGLAAQAVGRDDHNELWALLHRGVWIGAIGGIALIILAPLWMALAFLMAPASETVEPLARSYIGIRVLSAPAAIATYAMSGWLLAQERTRALLILQVGIAGLNAGLNYLFVLQFGWGIQGVAWASFIAEYTGLCAGLAVCFWRSWAQVVPRMAHVFDVARITHMFSVSGDIFIRSMLLQAMLVSFAFWGASFGDVELAANQILFQFWHVTAYALDGFAFAAEALVGHAVGRRARAQVQRAVALCGLWGGVGAVLTAGGIMLSAPWVIDQMTTAADVRAATFDYVIYAALAPIFGFLSWLMDGVFIGATRTKDMRNMMLISAIVYFGVALVIIPIWGNHGLWSAYCLSLVVRGFTMLWRYPELLRSVSA